MRNWIIGTALVIGGALVAFALVAVGVPPTVSCIGIAVSTTGFLIQMYTAFSTKARFEREQRASLKAYADVMQRAATLPARRSDRTASSRYQMNPRPIEATRFGGSFLF